jgi:hypothetical protein
MEAGSAGAAVGGGCSHRRARTIELDLVAGSAEARHGEASPRSTKPPLSRSTPPR